MNVKELIGSSVTNLRLHWNTPPFKKYVSFKEMIAYGIGGAGTNFLTTFTGCVSLTATSFLMGSAIGLKPLDLQYLNIISTILGFFLTAFRSYVFDNTHSKRGKFRPYLLTMGIPTMAVALIFVWLPYETMEYWQKIVAVLVCYNLIQLFSPFYTTAYGDLVKVMSPDSQERTNIISISSIVLSMAPTITGLVIPILSKTTGGLNRIGTYRIIYPAFALFGLIISYFAYFGTKERIVQAKTHVTQIKFFDAIRAIAKNKYFWITSLAGWIGFLEGATGVIFSWTFVYGHPDKMATYGVLTTVIGNSALWAMLLAPWIISRMGKRNLVILCNLMNIVFLALLYPFFQNIWIMTLLMYCNGFFTGFSGIYNQAINADVRDYQQYLTGERIDGMFGAIGILGSIIGMFTGLVLPAIYEMMGLKDNYDILYDEAVRNRMFRALIIASVIGATLNVIPYFFYDLTEDKHKNMISVLKIRSLFEDFGNGALSDENLSDTIDMIHEANRLSQEKPVEMNKDMIRKAKKEGGKHAVRAAKKEYRAIRHHNASIENAHIVMDEMNKFSTPLMQFKVKMAKEVYACGLDGLTGEMPEILLEARAMPKGTKEERAIRAAAIQMKKYWKVSRKLIPRYYPNGVKEPDAKAVDRAMELPEETKEESILRRKAIRAAVNERSRFLRAAKPYTESRRLLIEEENYKHYDEILSQYAAAKERTEERRRLEKEENDRLEAERLAHLEELKKEKLSKKGNHKK